MPPPKPPPLSNPSTAPESTSAPPVTGGLSASSTSSSGHASLPGPRTATASSASFGGPQRAESSRSNAQWAEDIEMESMGPGGHRRRRSSLMNPASRSLGPRATRQRGQSPHDQLTSHDEPKILEEDGDTKGALHNDTDNSLSDEDLHDDEETGLTRKERRRKEKKRRQNTTLDNRIAREKITAEDLKLADRSVVKKIAVNVGLILAWYLFSLSISLYNKWMFDTNKLNFPFPMFTTAIHMLIQFSLGCTVLYFVPSLRPRNGYKSDLGQSRHEAEPDRPVMTKMFYLTRIGPCGAATGLEIGLGNTSLQFITLTFYTMCKSSALAFVLLFAFLFRLEQPTWRLVAIIAIMTGGVIMMVAGEIEFHLGGLILVISAAAFSGFRWSLTQILLLRNPATSNPFSAIVFLAPVMFVTLFAIAIPVEGFFDLLAGFKILADEWGYFLTPILVLFPGLIAFCMTASEFALLQRTSVVTLSIAGIFKEVVTISTATLVFDDKLTTINISGLLVTMVAICAYNYIKITKMRQQAQIDVHKDRMESSSGFVPSSNSGSDAENDTSGEEAGLLRRSADFDSSHITADGDIIPKPEPSPTRIEHRSERLD